MIDPILKRVEVYRPDRPVEVLEQPLTLSAEEMLPGLVVDLTEMVSQ